MVPKAGPVWIRSKREQIQNWSALYSLYNNIKLYSCIKKSAMKLDPLELFDSHSLRSHYKSVYVLGCTFEAIALLQKIIAILKFTK